MATQATFTGGYYNLTIPGLGRAQHTYVIAKAGAKVVNFQCYGGVDPTHHEPGSVYPADLYTPSITNDRNTGKSAAGNLDAARAIATGDPNAPHRDNYRNRTGGSKNLGDNCNIVYAVTGVCHQMAARILYACGTPVVVWAPSVSASYWVYGFYGNGWELVQSTYDSYKRAPAALAALPADPQSAALKSYLQQGHTAAVRSPHVHEMLEARLGAEHAQRHLAPCLEKDLAHAATKRSLDIQLLRGEIANHEFAVAANSNFAHLARQLADIVGVDNFTRLFGVSPEQELSLSIDPDMMLETHRGLVSEV